ncbi:MAG TPA: hypothetical protein VJ327_07220 [Patescibacteria group bacterium]|nr:hypothetical protein [Patescibacteria group bacterium]
MFNGSRKVVSVVISDPTADARIPILVAPSDHSITVEKLSAALTSTLSGSTVNYVDLSLENGGTAGTAQTSIMSSIGGTAGWVANTIQSGAVTAGSGRLTAAQVLVLDYAETGTVAPGYLTVTVEYTDGLGAARN